MCSGRTHSRITFITAPLITGGAIFVQDSPNLVIPLITTASYVFAGLMFGPDLDIRSNQTKRWGWFRFIWIPYQKAFRHRSVFTHGIIIGTVVRLLYIGVVLFPVLVVVKEYAPEVYNVILQLITTHFLAIFVSIELGAASHYLADAICSTFKKLKKS